VSRIFKFALPVSDRTIDFSGGVAVTPVAGMDFEEISAPETGEIKIAHSTIKTKVV
jgi:hypothetical protein